MKILKTNDFVLERIQLQPITNAELDAAQKKAEKSQKFNFDDAYEFLRQYVDDEILQEVSEIRTLKTGNIRLVLTADKFSVTENPLKCTIYLKDNCWRTILRTGVSRRGPYATFDEMMAAFKKWITKKCYKIH